MLGFLQLFLIKHIILLLRLVETKGLHQKAPKIYFFMLMRYMAMIKKNKRGRRTNLSLL